MFVIPKVVSQFFFPTENFENVEIFQREHSLSDSRPDFYIESNGKHFIIECKINAQNHHFEQYIKTFAIPPNQLGYIVNYPLQKTGFDIKIWEQLYDYLKVNMPDDEKELYEAYLIYLENVCSIIKITTKMELKNMYSLYCFNEVLRSLTTREISTFSLNRHTRSGINGISYDRSGYYVQVSAKNKKLKREDIWIWIGVYYDREEPLVHIEVDAREGWGKPFFDKIKKDNGNYNLQYANAPYLEDNAYYFDGSTTFYEEFTSASTPQKQQETLRKFIDEVVTLYVA
jgi:hypothetical protein